MRVSGANRPKNANNNVIATTIESGSQCRVDSAANQPWMK
jgi:hypothetical protein